MTNTSTFSEEPLSQIDMPTGSAECSALVVLWSRDEPGRLGEALLIPDDAGRTWTFGRGELTSDAARARLKLVRQRPGQLEQAGALRCPRISRAQLQVSPAPGGRLAIENVGRCVLLHDGRSVQRIEIGPGELLELHN
jgi:hypothetical protein